MIDFKNFDWMSLFPDSLKRDKYMWALAKVFNTQISKIAQELDNIIIYPTIQQQPEIITDMLADDFNVKWYMQDYNLDAKRDIIQNCIKVHRKKGTPYAVETAVKAIHGGSSVQEWFEYGGEPYYFRLNIDVNRLEITEERFEQLLRQLIHLKNKRSILEKTTISALGEAVNYCGAYMAGVVMTYSVATSDAILVDELGNYLTDELEYLLTDDLVVASNENK